MSVTARAPGAAPLVLVHPRSRAEERLLRRWATAEHPGAVVVDAARRGPRVAVHLGAHLDVERDVVPARVVWNLPAGDDPGARLSDLVAAPLRRAPWPFLHRPLMRAVQGSATVAAGEPATTSDLRAAFASETGGESGFPDFVRRRALLACDRAERRLAGDRYKVPRLMVEQITASSDYLARADATAREAGEEPAAFRAAVRACLGEMTAVLSPLAIDLFRALTSPLHARAWHVEVDVEGLERLREINRTAPLVFLPSHRSYVDPLVLNEVLHRHDFPRNHVLGGDNMAFWPFGTIGRRAGVVFIRRSFGDDAAYKFAMREYLGHLMAKRFNLEWYIEGGRTRTGKLRHPRYGLLRYLVDALGHDGADGTRPDAVLVPTSIQYEQLTEVGAVVAEQTGAVKKAEGARWFVQYLREQRRHIGGARISFGEPFGLRAALADAGPGSAQLEKVAFRVCAGINAATPVMATSVVTFALLGTAGRALTFPQIMAVTEPLIDYLDRRGIPGPHTSLRDVEPVRETLGRLRDAGVVTCYDGGVEPVWAIPREQAHVAAFYRNGAVHHLLVRAVLELGLLRAERDDDPARLVDVGTVSSLALRDLLKFEFFFSDRRALRDELERETALIDPDWPRLGAAGPAATHLLDRCRTVVAPRALRPVFEAQRVLVELLLERDDAVGDRDAGDGGGEVERARFLEECVRVGHQRLLQGHLQDADSVSRELYASAWQLAANRGLTGAGDDVRAGLEALRDEVLDVLDLLERGARRDADLLREVLDD